MHYVAVFFYLLFSFCLLGLLRDVGGLDVMNQDTLVYVGGEVLATLVTFDCWSWPLYSRCHGEYPALVSPSTPSPYWSRAAASYPH